MIATGQDGAPMGKTFTVKGADEGAARANALTAAYATGYRTRDVLHVEQVEAGTWDVTVSYDIPAGLRAVPMSQDQIDIVFSWVAVQAASIGIYSGITPGPDTIELYHTYAAFASPEVVDLWDDRVQRNIGQHGR